ncbi:6-phosphofructokinase isozyme 2 [Arthrobacter saudimassiliensis]|uniref:6-phosphofructokinase isozyme 2 n=1 Tax=Arthrobacter saudimassiliensis TaxID=1461584 RepID=A0A078MIB3_9MICC|nr:6-phosphofructokinase isozyme 2 [Arthrobacter saudimassiliensis]
MIVTLTANPSLDRTVALPGPLLRGAVQRADAVSEEPGGKGVNVCRALTASGARALAVLPGADADPLITALAGTGVPYATLPISSALRSNITLTEPDGTTTKINEPGPVFTAAAQEQLLALLVRSCRTADGPARWAVLAGSLPPGLPADFYALAIHALREALGAQAPAVAVDSSGPPLLGALLHHAAPDLVKPNAEELAEASAVATGEELEEDPALAAAAARVLIRQGAKAVLATLGGKGALLVTTEGCWMGVHPPIVPRSTVGAGDSSLAGYLLAAVAGASPQDCLRQAVAHGAAAAALPGTALPAVADTTPEAVTVSAIVPAPLPATPAPAGTGQEED